MPRAIRVYEDNIDFVMKYAMQFGFNLDYVRDNMEYFAENGEALYVITDGSPEKNNITFTDLAEEDFRRTWKFEQHENPDQFVPIERV